MTEPASSQTQEHTLNFSEDILEAIMTSLSSGVLIADVDGRVRAVNAAAARYLNASGSELFGKRINEIPLNHVFVEIWEEVLKNRAAIRRREVSWMESDHERVFGVTASPIEKAHMIKGVVFLFTDLTEIREREKAAEIERQLAQVGELTAALVHEMRNPLSVISGMAELLFRKLSDQEALQRQAELIVQEVTGLEKLIRQFLSFSKPYELQRSSVTSAHIFERSVNLCAPLAKSKKVEIVVNPIASDTRRLSVDVTKIVQALSNLVRNAIEATPPGGRVILTEREEENEVCFRVEDTGSGLDASVKEKMFRPFFSTKEGGTGIGLALVHRIVHAHGGTIQCGNRSEGGAYFEIRLPRAHYEE